MINLTPIRENSLSLHKTYFFYKEAPLQKNTQKNINNNYFSFPKISIKKDVIKSEYSDRNKTNLYYQGKMCNNFYEKSIHFINTDCNNIKKMKLSINKAIKNESFPERILNNWWRYPCSVQAMNTFFNLWKKLDKIEKEFSKTSNNNVKDNFAEQGAKLLKKLDEVFS